MLVRVLFFDMDGTLVDSLPVAYKAFSEVMDAFGGDGSHEEFVRLSGMHQREIVRHLAEKTQSDPIELQQAFAKRFHSCYAEEVGLFPGSREILEMARSSGLPMLLVTAAQRPLAELIVSKHDLADFFDHIVTPCKLHASKPDPAVYAHAIELAGAAAEECVAFEDSDVGIRSAKGAGARSVWMNHKGESFHPDYEHLIDHTFNDWNTVTTWLKDGIEGQTR